MTQLVVAVAPLFVPPVLELVADLRGEPDRPLQLFVGTLALTTLAFLRTRRLIRSEERTRHQLEVARDAALAASEAKSMFVANVSHELRTPLTTMLASAEILEDSPLDEGQRGLLAKMQRSGDVLGRTVEGMLDFARLETGELVLAATPFDLGDLVADTTAPFLPRARESGVSLEWQVDPRVDHEVVGDPRRLRQVLGHLLDNAVKFTHEGRIVLTVQPTESPAAGGGDDVEFRVSDTGIGIREEDHDSVFDSFSQVDGSTTRRYGGSGLGLALCKELAELMDGSVRVESRLGVGSTFVLTVPLAAARQHVEGRVAPVRS